jgi:hypothetical protein
LFARVSISREYETAFAFHAGRYFLTNRYSLRVFSNTASENKVEDDRQMTLTWIGKTTKVGNTKLTIHTSPQGLYYFEAEVTANGGGKWHHPGREMRKTVTQARSDAEMWLDAKNAGK